MFLEYGDINTVVLPRLSLNKNMSLCKILETSSAIIFPSANGVFQKILTMIYFCIVYE